MKKILVVVEDVEHVSIQFVKAIALRPRHIHLSFVTEQGSSGNGEIESRLQELLDANSDGSISWSSCSHDLNTEVDKANIIKNLVDEQKIDLVLLSRHFHVGEDDIVYEKSFLRELRTAIMVVGNSKWKKSLNLLCALDMADNDTTHKKLNEKVLQQTVDIGETLGANLHAVSIIPISRVTEELDIVEPSEVLTSHGDEAMKVLKAYVQQQIEKPVECHVEAGNRAKSIAKVAKKVKTGILVVGNVGRSGIEGFFVGNTVEKVIKHWRKDMLILHI